MLITGAAMMMQMAASNTILQTIVDEDKRGRVMSFYTMAFFGTAPFGSLLAGWLAERIGAPDTILLGGVCCVAGAALFLRELPELRRAVRPIYVRLGILPASAGRRAARADRRASSGVNPSWAAVAPQAPPSRASATPRSERVVVAVGTQVTDGVIAASLQIGNRRGIARGPRKRPTGNQRPRPRQSAQHSGLRYSCDRLL